MKLGLLKLNGGRFLAAVTVVGLAGCMLAAAENPPSETPSAAAVSQAQENRREVLQSVRAAGEYSSGLSEIAKLVDAKIDPKIVITFVKASPIAYQPSADDIVKLKEHGASNEVIEAILNHGSNLRSQPPSQVAVATAPAPAAPTIIYRTQSAPTYVASYDYSYYYPSYSYGWYNYGWAWPYSYVYWGYPYRHYYAPYRYGYYGHAYAHAGGYARGGGSPWSPTLPYRGGGRPGPGFGGGHSGGGIGHGGGRGGGHR
jgi:hypothetical protein